MEGQLPEPEPKNVNLCIICKHHEWKNGFVTCNLCEERHIHLTCLPTSSAGEEWHCDECKSALTFLASLQEGVDKVVASLEEGVGKAAVHMKEGVNKAGSALYKAAEESSKLTSKMIETGFSEAGNEHTDVALLNVLSVLKDLKVDKMDGYYDFLRRQMNEKKERKRKRSSWGP